MDNNVENTGNDKCADLNKSQVTSAEVADTAVYIVGVKIGEHTPTVTIAAPVLLKRGGSVVVMTQRGLEYGTVIHVAPAANPARQQPKRQCTFVRVATKADFTELEKQRRREKELLLVFGRKIKEYKVAMKPVNVECTLDGGKITFYFTSETRVDFRGLVKELAAFCRSRVELRQVGSRDEARLLGGIGICGREFCCKSFLTSFQPVSIRMAKEQSMSLNPTKTAGNCGRLLCCLKYEQSMYDKLIKEFPRIGTVIDTPKGNGVIEEVNYISGDMRVRLAGSNTTVHIKKNTPESDGSVAADGGVFVRNTAREGGSRLQGGSKHLQDSSRFQGGSKHLQDSSRLQGGSKHLQDSSRLQDGSRLQGGSRLQDDSHSQDSSRTVSAGSGAKSEVAVTAGTASKSTFAKSDTAKSNGAKPPHKKAYGGKPKSGKKYPPRHRNGNNGGNSNNT